MGARTRDNRAKIGSVNLSAKHLFSQNIYFQNFLTHLNPKK